MQNAFVYHLVSGDAWFSCGIVFIAILCADFSSFFASRKWAARTGRVTQCLLLVGAALSGTSFPLWFAVPLGTACATYSLVGFSKPGKARHILRFAALALILISFGFEIPWRIIPPPSGTPTRLFILGDSITAGVTQKTYPKPLAAAAGIVVEDFAIGGATAQTAFESQAPRLPESKSGDWVLIEIGGNDMFGRTADDTFEHYLDQLLAAARGPKNMRRTVLMFELPLMPGYWSIGRIQRRLSKTHEVVLIPKCQFAALLLASGNTVDGVHLSENGHDRMVELLLPWLGFHKSR